MEVTRKVIQDLLPLYLAGEVSEETRVLVETYLQNDPELAKIVEENEGLNLNGELTISRSEEDALKTYQKSRTMMIVFIILMAGILAFVVYILLYSFFTPV
jgi:hypothetical protein